jgi:hypothetical protein
MSGIYDQVQNPIPHSDMWTTPETIEQLMAVLEASTSCPTERRMIMMGAMFALNTAHHLVENKILNQEVFI